MNGNSGMADVQALINALARACIEREKAEGAAQAVLAENGQLRARITELEAQIAPKSPPETPPPAGVQ